MVNVRIWPHCLSCARRARVTFRVTSSEDRVGYLNPRSALLSSLDRGYPCFSPVGAVYKKGMNVAIYSSVDVAICSSVKVHLLKRECGHLLKRESGHLLKRENVHLLKRGCATQSDKLLPRTNQCPNGAHA